MEVWANDWSSEIATRMFGRLLSFVETPFANGAIKRHAMKSNTDRDAFVPKQAFGNLRYGLFVEKVIGWMVISKKIVVRCRFIFTP